MKRVVLIGDSIRMGYQEAVRRELAGLAEVIWTEDNGGDSRKVLANIEAWGIGPGADVIHINAGLHDLKVNRQTHAYQVPVDEYARNIEQILKTLAGRTNATVIWAMTTPVNECWHRERKPFDRFQADVAAYNQKAAEVCAKLGVTVDDIYAVMAQAGPDRYLELDGVHFNEAGYELLGKEVAGVIRRVMA